MVAVRQVREMATQMTPMILRESASADVSWGEEGGRGMSVGSSWH